MKVYSNIMVGIYIYSIELIDLLYDYEDCF